MGIDVVPPGCTEQKSLGGLFCSRKQSHTNTVAVHHSSKLLRICLLPSRYQRGMLDPLLGLMRQVVAYQIRAEYLDQWPSADGLPCIPISVALMLPSGSWACAAATNADMCF